MTFAQRAPGLLADTTQSSKQNRKRYDERCLERPNRVTVTKSLQTHGRSPMTRRTRSSSESMQGIDRRLHRSKRKVGFSSGVQIGKVSSKVCARPSLWYSSIEKMLVFVSRCVVSRTCQGAADALQPIQVASTPETPNTRDLASAPSIVNLTTSTIRTDRFMAIFVPRGCDGLFLERSTCPPSPRLRLKQGICDSKPS